MAKGYEQIDKEIEEINEMLLKKTNGKFQVMPTIPTSLYPIIPQSLWNFWGMPKNFQRLQQMNHFVKGRVGWFVCQTSHGTQQIKLYQPWIYKNDVNTPLRIRSRKIMQLAAKEPKEIRKEKVRELYRTMPFELLKSEAVKLRLKNFHFERGIRDGDVVKIYRIDHDKDKTFSPENAIAGSNEGQLYWEGEYKANKGVHFEYGEVEEQFFYAINTRNSETSNVLSFIWQEEIEFAAKGEKKPNKMALVAEMLYREDEAQNNIDNGAAFKKSKHSTLFHENRDSKRMVISPAMKKKDQLSKRSREFINELLKMNRKLKIVTDAGVFGHKKKE